MAAPTRLGNMANTSAFDMGLTSSEAVRSSSPSIVLMAGINGSGRPAARTRNCRLTTEPGDWS